MLRPYLASHRGGKRLHDIGQIVVGHRFVEGDADPGLGQRSQIDLFRASDFDDSRKDLLRYFNRQCVKEARIRETVTEVLKGSAEPCRVAVHASRDAAQPVRAVIDGVHRGHDRQQHLRGADIARRFFAADMLLAGRQGQHPAAPALGVCGFSD